MPSKDQEKKCTCEEITNSDRFCHHYDGKSCHVKDAGYPCPPPPQYEEWEKEFDKQFVWNMTPDDHDVVAHYNEEDRELEFWNAYKIKFFISSLLQEEKEKTMQWVREKIASKKPILYSEDTNRYIENVAKFNLIDEILSDLQEPNK